MKKFDKKNIKFVSKVV